jgi:CheY-like chemotaxis protein
MGLECLIVTCDPGLLGHVQASMGTHAASFQFRQDCASAIELASRRHLDGVVIDCDVLEGAATIPALRGIAANRQTLILALVNGFISAEEALSLGADFVIRKPIERSRLREILDVAVPKMEREHRRYFRYDVDLPVRFQTSPGQSFAGRMKNVSENGLAVKLLDPLRLKGVVTVEFELPSVSAQVFHAKADVVWSDSFAMGLRFLHVDRDSGVALQGWLKSLEARSCFREPATRNG